MFPTPVALVPALDCKWSHVDKSLGRAPGDLILRIASVAVAQVTQLVNVVAAHDCHSPRDWSGAPRQH